jgi:hypothetical protein
MEDELTLDVDGVEYTVTYIVYNDTLTALLPDGSQRTTELRGLNPISAARTHLRHYIGSDAQLKHSAE